MSALMDSAARAIPTRVIRVGVIGTGFGETVHVPALQAIPYVEVASICSRRLDRAQLVAARRGIRKATADFRELIRDPEVDAVVIASPPNLHHSMAFAAIEAGKHVLCEKPMSRTLAEARDLVKLAEQARVVAMVNHQFRFEPARAHARSLIESGWFGDPHVATVTVYRSTLNDPHGVPWDWLMDEAKGGGMLGAAGSHYLDALRWWFGDVRAVSGAASTMIKQRRHADSNIMGTVSADDNFVVLLRFMNGALATVTYSATAAFEAGEQIILSGSSGMLMMTGDRKLYGAKRGGPLDEISLPEHLTAEVSPTDHALLGPTSMLLRHWISAIRTGDVVSPSFLDGLKVQELMDGAIRSSQLGRWVEIEKGRFANF
jgi:predicted dehydrogenase